MIVLLFLVLMSNHWLFIFTFAHKILARKGKFPWTSPFASNCCSVQFQACLSLTYLFLLWHFWDRWSVCVDVRNRRLCLNQVKNVFGATLALSSNTNTYIPHMWMNEAFGCLCRWRQSYILVYSTMTRMYRGLRLVTVKKKRVFI